MEINKTSFWDNKILNWEKNRYYSTIPTLSQTPDEFKGNSIQFRLYSAAKILFSKIKGTTLLDLGCGSGLFFDLLEKAQPKKLYGIDYSESAIAQAQKKHSSDLFQFTAGSVLDLPLPETEYVTALGLIDWFTLDEIQSLCQKLKGRKFIFSYSEKRRPILRGLHYLFVMASYGWKTKGYIPIYYSQQQIEETLKKAGMNGPFYYLRHEKMSFSTFVSNFPLEI